ncbi:MAG: amidohydrolase [Nitrospirota bacterium]
MQREKPDRHADILLTNGMVLTMDSDNRIIENGAVAIEKDTIAAVGNADDMGAWTSSRIIDAGGGIIMPGLINTHTHAAMTLFRGIADDLPLMDWLNHHIFPAEARLDRRKVGYGTKLACAEMILSGTTCFCDMYLFEDAVADAASEAGMRAVVGEVLYDFPSPHYGPIGQGFAFTRQLIERWKGDPLIVIAVEPHSPYLCAPELLQTAASIAHEHNLPLIMHVSETMSEISIMKERYGKTPVQYLADLGILSPNLLACHCVFLTDADISLLHAYGVKVSHNPESNMKLASGIAPVPALLRKGVCVGLGTDGCSSNNNLDLFLEMDTAAKLHKVDTSDPTVMNSRTVLRMSTIDGARALGLEEVTGSLEPGKKADIIVMNTAKPHLTPMYHPESHMVYAAKGSDVEMSVINGKVVMEKGRLLTIDIDEVMEEVNWIAKEISNGR